MINYLFGKSLNINHILKKKKTTKVYSTTLEELEWGS